MVDLIINKSVPQRWGFLILGLLFIALVGCWDGMSKAGVDETEPGEIQLQLEWLTDTNGFTAKQSPSGDVCIDFLIENIRVRVVSSASSTVASQEWPCSFHSGTLSDIPPGSGYSVEVDGLIGDQVQWHGDAVDVTVTSGQSTGPISIEMSYVGNDDIPPTVDSTSPVDQSDNIATDTAITIVFNEAVVDASVDAASITVTFGPDTVAGTVSYDPVTYTAVFQPQQELAVATTYTVTVTTDVMDLAGHNMEQDYTFSFTTTTVWYVDGNSPSSGTGQSWVEAFNNISDAVAAAGSGDQIWVLATNYVLTGTINVNKVVSIFGGFDGTESHLSQRDWQSNTTVIDGNATVRCLFVNADATFDGLTIRNGSIVGPTPAPEGSGMFIDIASPTIVNCTFSENVAGPSTAFGGALYISSGSPIISNCLFQDNRVDSGTEGFGGAIYNYQSSPTISNCTFVGNQVTGGFGNFGGAIFNDVSTPIIRDCIFTQNGCFGDIGEGGAINNQSGNVVIERCTFSENSAGGFSGYGGAISNKQSSNATITNCIFDRNSASGASGTGQGGAVSNRFNGTATITITNCSFALNRTTGGGGDYGGAVYNQDSATLANCILWGNTATNGSQIYDEPPDASSTVVYCVIDQAGYDGSNNNIRRNPMFGANLHLRTNSPCIDQGDNTAAPANDVDGETRPQSAVVDIGADEFLDTDGDQMPDYWEILYGLNKDVIDAGGDPDGDLLTNLSEYQIDTDPQEANVVLNAVNRGWWDDTGFHNQADNSTQIGRVSGIIIYRSYFSFDLSGVAGSVTRAALRLELASYDSINSSETIEIWDVSTPAATLEASATGQTAIYNDLGTGNRYTGWTVTPPDEGVTLEFYLNTQAVSDIDGAVGSTFSVGAALESLLLDQTLSFSSGSEARIHQLVLTTE